MSVRVARPSRLNARVEADEEHQQIGTDSVR